MADMKIDPTQAKEWAQERTLASLLNAVGDSNQILKSISQNRASNIDLSRQLRREANEFQRSTRDVNAATSDLRSSLRNATEATKYELKGYARNIGDAGGLANQFGSTMRNVTDAIGRSKFADLIPGLKTTLAGLSFSVGYGLEQLTQARSVFSGLTQSGLLFKGNVLDFSAEVRGAGLDVREFGRLAAQYSEGMVMFGEGRFLKSVNNLRDTFVKFNLRTQEGTEYFAEFIDNMRVTGTGYLLTMDQQEQAFKTQLQQQQAIAALTGVSIKRQKEQEARLVRSARYQAVEASMSPQERLNLAAVRTQLGAVFNEDQIERLVLAAKEGVVGKESTALVTALNQLGIEIQPAIGALGQGLRGDTGAIDVFLDQMAQQVKRREGTGFYGNLAAQMTGSGMGREYGEILMGLRGKLLPRAFGTTGARAAEIAAGQAPVDEATQMVNRAISDFEVAIGKLNQKMTEMASKGLKEFTTQMERLSTFLTEKDIGKQLKELMDNLENNILVRASKFLTEKMGFDPISFVKENAVELGLAGLAGKTAYNMYQAAKSRFGGGAPPLPGAAGPAATPMLGGATGAARRAFGLLGAGSTAYSLSQGNYADALLSGALTLGSFFATKGNAALVAVSLLDTYVKVKTGTGLISGMFGEEAARLTTARERIQERAAAQPPSPAEVAPITIPPGARVTESMIVALEAQMKPLIDELSRLTAQGLDPRNARYRELSDIISRQTLDLERALRNLQ